MRQLKEQNESQLEYLQQFDSCCCIFTTWFMDGIVGQFMKQFGLSVVYLVLLSSVFSFTLTPMMIAKFYVRDKIKR